MKKLPILKNKGDNMDLPNRKTTRLKDYDYSTPGAYFVTICTKDRKEILSLQILSFHVLYQPLSVFATKNMVKTFGNLVPTTTLSAMNMTTKTYTNI